MQNFDRNILITGYSGFLGKIVFNNLLTNSTLSLFTLGRTSVQTNHINTDLSINDIKLPNISFSSIIHLAGKAHSYPKTLEEIKQFENVNYHGTRNLLISLENQKSIKSFIFASTVAVYGIEEGQNIKETFSANPDTPYGKSKLAAEKAIIEWCKKKNITYFILRIPLIVGDNPPGNLGKMKNAIQKGYYLRIKENNAQKSMVLATDLANLITNLVTNTIDKSGIYNLTDGYNPTFNELEKTFEFSMKKQIRFNVSISLLKFFSKIGDILESVNIKIPVTTKVLNKITSSLTFNDDKAITELGWKPNSVIKYLYDSK